jgi:5-methylcytosine-specific restriction endonuclease McrA
MLQRPIFGGIFGKGRFSLATLPCVSNGLHAVRFMVVDPRAGSVLSVSEDKGQALAAARRMLRGQHVSLREAANDPQWEQCELWKSTELPPVLARAVKVSRRRRQIFERSEGKCHYCRRTLALDGKWHVEHMLPRALGGSDHSLNTVAACPECNLQKRDRTAIEFLAEQESSEPIGA